MATVVEITLMVVVWLLVLAVATTAITAIRKLYTSVSDLQAQRRRRFGSTGATGTIGATGENGENGDDGAIGPIGPTGTAAAGTPNYAHFMSFPLIISIDNPPITYDNTFINPWGIAVDTNPTGAPDSFWIAINGSGTLKHYSYISFTNPNPTGDQGYPVFPLLTLLDTVPTDDLGPITGVTVRASTDTGFVVSGTGGTGPARLITVSEEGKIYAYNSDVGSTAITVVDNSGTNANYKGCDTLGNRFYVSNFTSGSVEMYDENWLLLGTFTDPDPELVVVQGFAPWNVRIIGVELFVTFALSDGSTDRPVGAVGNGLIDNFLLDGTFISRWTGLGSINGPYGMTTIPATQTLSGVEEMVVCNWADGRLLRYGFATNAFYGFLSDRFVNQIVLSEVWDSRYLPNASAGGVTQLITTQSLLGDTDGFLHVLMKVAGMP